MATCVRHVKRSNGHGAADDAAEDAAEDFRHWLWDDETWRFDVPRALVFFGSLGIVRKGKVPVLPPPKAKEKEAEEADVEAQAEEAEMADAMADDMANGSGPEGGEAAADHKAEAEAEQGDEEAAGDPLALPSLAPSLAPGWPMAWDEVEAMEARPSAMRCVVEGQACGLGSYRGPVDGARRPHGRGVLTYPNGDEYRGGFSRGVRCGVRCGFKHADGAFYFGGFAGGAMHGAGVWVQGGVATAGEWCSGVASSAALRATIASHATLLALAEKYTPRAVKSTCHVTGEDRAFGPEAVGSAPPQAPPDAATTGGLSGSVPPPPALDASFGGLGVFGSAPAPPDNSAEVQKILGMGMGFEKNQVIAALATASGDANAAVEALIASM
jgi:hypothetical protein